MRKRHGPAVRARSVQLGLLILLLYAGYNEPLFADIIEVPTDFPTIQAAIDASQDGDEIIVSPGIYDENIDFLDKDIVVRSTDPMDDEIVRFTAIHGDVSARVVTMSAGHLRGLTIRYGDGCVLATGSSVVEYCRMFACDADWGGGGVYATDNAVVRANLIQSNFSRSVLGGGGVYAEDLVWVVGNTIHANQALSGGREGGGVWAQGQVLVEGNLITNNSAYEGGGIYLFGGAVALDNEIIGNSAEDGGGVWAGSTFTQVLGNIIRDNEAEDDGGGVFSKEHTVVRDNMIEGNTAGDDGGGIYASGVGDAVVEMNLITLNVAGSDGGGVRCDNGVLVTRNIITQNMVVADNNDTCRGGGCHVGGGVTVRGNLIAGNSAVCGSPAGGGAYCETVIPNTLWFLDNTLVDNFSEENGGGLAVAKNATIKGNIVAFSDGESEIYITDAEDITLAYNCFFDDDGDIFSGQAEQLAAAGTGNLTEDPLLEPDFIHLSLGSPCINTGDPASDDGLDIDGEERIQGGRIDIGADETDGACPLDFDCDGVPNVQDNCLFTFNPDQIDADGDGQGDVCDDDDDNDGVEDVSDNCPFVPNMNQRDTDGDGVGDFCDVYPREMLIWDNGDRALGYGSVASQIALDYPFEAAGADDILLAEQNPDAPPQMRVTGMEWSGNFDTGSFEPIDAFHIYIYDNAPGADLVDGGDAPTGGPDDPTPTAVHAMHLQPGQWTETAINAQEYDFSATMPPTVQVQTDVRLWLEIQIDLCACGSDQYFWSTTDESYGWNATRAFDFFGINYWSRYLGPQGPADVVFSLTGENVPGPGDIDRNDTIDLHDVALFQQCFSGNGVPFDHNRVFCFRADIDADDDVDGSDFVELAVSLQSQPSG